LASPKSTYTRVRWAWNCVSSTLYCAAMSSRRPFAAIVSSTILSCIGNCGGRPDAISANARSNSKTLGRYGDRLGPQQAQGEQAPPRLRAATASNSTRSRRSRTAALLAGPLQRSRSARHPDARLVAHAGPVAPNHSQPALAHLERPAQIRRSLPSPAGDTIFSQSPSVRRCRASQRPAPLQPPFSSSGAEATWPRHRNPRTWLPLVKRRRTRACGSPRRRNPAPAPKSAMICSS